MNYCPLPLTDKRRAYVPADHTDIAETFRQHEPIRVSPIRDDYENVQALDSKREFHEGATI